MTNEPSHLVYDLRLACLEPTDAGIGLLEPVRLPADKHPRGAPHLDFGLLRAPFAFNHSDAFTVSNSRHAWQLRGIALRQQSLNFLEESHLEHALDTRVNARI